MISNRETYLLARVQVNDRSQIPICTVLTGQIGNIADVHLVRSTSMKPPLYQVCENWIRRTALGSHGPAMLGKAT